MEETTLFECSEDNAAQTVPLRAGLLRKGTLIVADGRPCRVVEVTVSQPGKHGHAKANFVALDIFSGHKKVGSCKTSHNLQAPVVRTETYLVMDESDDGFLSLLDDQGETRQDLRCPADDAGGAKLRSALAAGAEVHVAVTRAMGTELITSVSVTGS